MFLIPLTDENNQYVWSQETRGVSPTFQVSAPGQAGDGMRGPAIVLNQYFGLLPIDWSRRADYDTGDIRRVEV